MTSCVARKAPEARALFFAPAKRQGKNKARPRAWLGKFCRRLDCRGRAIGFRFFFPSASLAPSFAPFSGFPLPSPLFLAFPALLSPSPFSPFPLLPLLPLLSILPILPLLPSPSSSRRRAAWGSIGPRELRGVLRGFFQTRDPCRAGLGQALSRLRRLFFSNVSPNAANLRRFPAPRRDLTRISQAAPRMRAIADGGLTPSPRPRRPA